MASFLVFCLLLSACSVQQIKPARMVHAKGVYHRVKSGETLASIARAYHIDMQDLAEVNNIENLNLIGVDSVVFVPDANQVIDDVMASVRKVEAPVKTPVKAETQPKVAVVQKKQAPVSPPAEEVTKSPTTAAGPGSTKIRINPRRDIARLPSDGEDHLGAGSSPKPKDVSQKAVVKEPEPMQKPAVRDEQTTVPKIPPSATERGPEQKAAPDTSKGEPESLRFDRKRFIWPVRGRVISRFGIQPDGTYSNGITISAREGLPVVAAADGKVLVSGPVKGYGETVIMQHDDHYATVYTHLGQRKVKTTDRLKKGDQIGMPGAEEKRGDGQLHFEIRYKTKARNPMFFLP
jgi:lipoprotein NlpD